VSKKTHLDDIVTRRDAHVQRKVTGKKLVDISSTGRVRPWVSHKKTSFRIAKSYERLGMADIAEKMLNCGNWLVFEEDDNPACNYKRLKMANFCRGRNCSMCQWRKSYYVAQEVRKVCHEAYQAYYHKGKLRWLLLTLTVRNVHGHKALKETLDAMMSGWQRFIQRKQVRGAVVGTFRALEVTVNDEKFRKYTQGTRKGQFMRDKKGNLIPNEWYGSYHPHFHVLVAVKSSYFKGKDYIKQAEWQALWKEACRLDYDPQVDVRPVKGKRDDDWEVRLRRELANLTDMEKEAYLKIKSMEGAVAEVSKYATKAADILTPNDAETDRRLWDLHTALRGRRFLGYTGLLRDCWMKLRREGKAQDVEAADADLVKIGDEPETCTCPACGSDLVEVVYGWFAKDGEYYKVKQKEKSAVDAELEAERAVKTRGRQDETPAEVDVPPLEERLPEPVLIPKEKRNVTAFDLDAERAAKYFEDGGKVDSVPLATDVAKPKRKKKMAEPVDTNQIELFD
jgi:plasmid rolling circle replication initiator protein Rep